MGYNSNEYHNILNLLLTHIYYKWRASTIPRADVRFRAELVGPDRGVHEATRESCQILERSSPPAVDDLALLKPNKYKVPVQRVLVLFARGST